MLQQTRILEKSGQVASPAWLMRLALIAFVAVAPVVSLAQAPLGRTGRANEDDLVPTEQALQKQTSLIAEVLEPEIVVHVDPERSKLFRTLQPVSRFSITDPEVIEVVQFGPTEFELIGLERGQTTLTLWFGEGEALRYLVKVGRQTDGRVRDYSELQKMINELFPNSMVQIFPIADKVIVRGEARDSAEASQIMSIIRDQGSGIAGAGGGFGYGALLNQGTAATVFPGESEESTSTIINLLVVPGEQQVMLKVRVAELSRSALREMGLDFEVAEDNFFISSVLGSRPNISTILDGGDVSLFIQAFSSNGHSKILAEPNLVTLSGRPASFIAGGQFAVPTAVGIGGVQAATTFFQGFGTQILFTPTVIDKDKIRLQVAPTFSTVNNDLAVNGIPGLNTRAVYTTVDMRAGQWLAIAGLLQDEQRGGKARIPGLGDIPVIDSAFSNKTMQRNETELIVLVSPELVHPLEPEQAPPILPGMEVTEPGPLEFYALGRIEGDPNVQHRSTVWPVQRDNIRKAIRDAKREARYQRSQGYFVSGPHGFSE